LRLEPTDEARIMAALEMIERNTPEVAIRLLRRMLSAPLRSDIAACVWNNLGMAHTFLGEMSEAFDCHGQACMAERSRLEPWLNRLVLGVQLGRSSESEAASKVVDELAEASEEVIKLFARAKRIQREQGQWSPTLEGRASARRLESASGAGTRRIVSVFD
jgi:hypothetical protein